MSIDDLLTQPLPPVADNGFSAHVMSRVRAAERRRMALIGAGSVAGAALGCVFIPLQAISLELNHAIVQVGTSTAVGFAGAVLLLTILFDRRFFRI